MPPRYACALAWRCEHSGLQSSSCFRSCDCFTSPHRSAAHSQAAHPPALRPFPTRSTVGASNGLRMSPDDRMRERRHEPSLLTYRHLLTHARIALTVDVVLGQRRPRTRFAGHTVRARVAGPDPRPHRMCDACSATATCNRAAPYPYTRHAAFSTTSVRIGYKFL